MREILIHEGKIKACMLNKASMTVEGSLNSNSGVNGKKDLDHLSSYAISALLNSYQVISFISIPGKGKGLAIRAT